MFEKSLTRLDDIYQEADKAILKHRNTLDVYFKIIDEYIKENKLIKSDIYELIDAYSSKVPSMDKKNPYYTLYSCQALIDANKLTNILAEKNEYVVLSTKILNHEFEIAIEGMKLITIKHIKVYKEVSVIEVMKSFYGYLAPELEIMMLYKKLYSPHWASEWDDNLKVEPQLHDICKSRLDTIRGYVGGKQTWIESKTQIINYILGSAYRNELILTGEVAYDIYTTKHPKLNDIFQMGEKKVQLIGDISPDELVARLNKLNLDGIITYKRQSLHIPFDERQQKYTFYSQYNDRTCIIFELYNNTEYELIPYHEIKVDNNIIMIGTFQFGLYMTYIDIWVIQLISAIGQLHEKSKYNKLSVLYDLVDKYRNIIYDKSYLELFKEYKHFKGTYKDEKLYYKTLLVSANVQPYTPSVYKKINGKYRDIISKNK